MTRLKHKPPVANIKDLVYLGQVVGSGISRAAQEPRTCIQVERQWLYLHAPRGLQDCHRLLGQGSYHTSASLLTCGQNQTCQSPPPAHSPGSKEPCFPHPLGSVHLRSSSLPQGLCLRWVLYLGFSLGPASSHPPFQKALPSRTEIFPVSPPCT